MNESKNTAKMELNKKYTVKSKTLPDAWVFTYDLHGHLVSFECVNSIFNAKKCVWLMNQGRFPYSETSMKHWIKAFQTQFQIEIDLPEINFEYFWNAYNKKVGKKETKTFWDKSMKTGEHLTAVLAIKRYNNFLRTQKNREKIDPVRYLKNRRYEDEY